MHWVWQWCVCPSQAAPKSERRGEGAGGWRQGGEGGRTGSSSGAPAPHWLHL